MKKHAVTLLILTLVALPGLASAQTRTVMKADVPFDFVANGKSMPAGSCTVTSSGDAITVLQIACGGQKISALPNASETLQPSGENKLVFHRYSGRYFLAGIERAGESRGYQLPVTGLETELRASSATESDVVLIASAR